MRNRKWRPGRQAPQVKRGTVQKKERWDYYPRIYDFVPNRDGSVPIVREPAYRGYRHVVTESDLRRFTRLIPGWDRLRVGLRGLVIGEGNDDCIGWHELGIVCIHAWSARMSAAWTGDFFREHKPVLDRLMVPSFKTGDDEVVCQFNPKTAAGFQLMHVFLHELGHHHDRMQTRKQINSALGEQYAEDFGNQLADQMWTAFFRTFGW